MLYFMAINIISNKEDQVEKSLLTLPGQSPRTRPLKRGETGKGRIKGR
jgi:hypothetical protein